MIMMMMMMIIMMMMMIIIIISSHHITNNSDVTQIMRKGSEITVQLNWNCSYCLMYIGPYIIVIVEE